MSDYASVDALIDALYDTISGPAGSEPDWQRLRSLYLPGALLVRTSTVSADTPRSAAMDVEGFIAGSGGYLRTHDFYEREVARSTRRFGNIAQAMSTYESAETPDGAPFARGVNSIQAVRDRGRWWLVSVVWDIERAGNPVPAEYLPAP